jgi:mannitol-specific phosphotransferase system IIBC component
MKITGKFLLILIAVLVATLFAMCIDQESQGTQKTQDYQNYQQNQKVQEDKKPQNQETQEGKSSSKKQITFPQFGIFYYYHPLCPNCQKIKPYIDLMMNVTEIDACNVGNLSTCSEESIVMLKLLDSQGKFLGVPTIAVVEDNNVTLLIGWKQALKLGEIVEKHGIAPPPVIYNNSTYTIQECVDCHSAKGLKPPSTFSCTYCCHTGEQSG